MAAYSDDLEQELGVPMLDPVKLALKVAKAMVDMGVTHSQVRIVYATNPKGAQMRVRILRGCAIG